MDDIIQSITGLSDLEQILLITFSTFISEDITTIVSATSYFTGAISTSVFYIGISCGIILSDTVVYLIGRAIGYKRDRILFLNIKALREKSSKYESQGFLFLVITRFTPGLRAPSLFAAGLCGYNIINFLVAKSISVVILISLIEFFGTIIISFINDNKIILAIFFISLVIAIYIIYRVSTGNGFKVFFYSIVKYRFFEFWPATIFYIPPFLYYIYLGIKNWNLMLPVYANPVIKYGGFICEKKSEIQKLFNTKSSSYLKIELIKGNLSAKNKLERLGEFLYRKKLDYPIIIKPNIGQRGQGVKLVKNERQAKKIFKNLDYDVIAQEYCDYKNEMGVFFYYSVNSNIPHISSLTLKEFPIITGDGKSTIKELILKDKRARYIAGLYLTRMGEDKQLKVLRKGKTLSLVSAGNHAQGCVFKDGKQYIDKDLVQVFDKIASKIKGFYIGRFDIKYKNIEDLKNGKNFKIIELNGSGAEATHIYDRKVNIFKAYSTLFKQWNLIFERGKFCKKNNLYNYDIDEFASDYFKFLKESKRYEISS